MPEGNKSYVTLNDMYSDVKAADGNENLSFDDFTGKLKNPEKASALYSYLKDNDKKVPDTFEDFQYYYGLKKKDSSVQPSGKPDASSLPPPIFSNLNRTAPVDETDDIKNARDASQKGTATPEQKEQLNLHAEVNKVAAVFSANPGKYKNQEERDKYYDSLGLDDKQKQIVKQNGDATASLLEGYDLDRRSAFNEPSATNLSFLSATQTHFGDGHTAMATADTIKKQYPESPEGNTAAAYTLGQNGNMQAAAAEVFQATLKDPNNPFTLSIAAQTLIQGGNKQQAVDAANGAISNLPTQVNDIESLRNSMYAYKVRASLRRQLGNETGAADDDATAQRIQEDYRANHIDPFLQNAVDKSGEKPNDDLTAEEKADIVSKGGTLTPEQQLEQSEFIPGNAGTTQGTIGRPSIPSDLMTNPSYQGVAGFIKQNSLWWERNFESIQKGFNDVYQDFADITSTYPVNESDKGAKSITDLVKNRLGKTMDLFHDAFSIFGTAMGAASLTSPLFESAQKDLPQGATKWAFDLPEQAGNKFFGYSGESKLSRGGMNLLNDAWQVLLFHKGSSIAKGIKGSIGEEISNTNNTPAKEDIYMTPEEKEVRSKVQVQGVSKGSNVIAQNEFKFKAGQPITLSDAAKMSSVMSEAANDIKSGKVTPETPNVKQVISNNLPNNGNPVENKTEAPAEQEPTPYTNENGVYKKDGVKLTNPKEIELAKKAIAAIPEEKKPPVMINNPAVVDSGNPLLGKYINENYSPKEEIEARAAGSKVVDGKLYVRHEPLKDGVYGKRAALNTVPDETIETKYVLHNPKDIVNSHINGVPNHESFLTDGIPANRYSLIGSSPDFGYSNPEFLGASDNMHSGAPVINERGEVIQGNGRNLRMNMGLDDTYYDYLKAHAKEFGFSADQIEEARKKGLGMYREYVGKKFEPVRLSQLTEEHSEDPTPERLAAEIFNQSLTPTASKDIHNAIINGGNQEILAALVQNKLLNPLQAGKMISGGDINPDGVKSIQSIIDGQIAVGGDNDLHSQVKSLPKAAHDNLTNAIFQIHSMGAYSFLPELQEAIRAYSHYLKDNPKNLSLPDFLADKDEQGRSLESTLGFTQKSLINMLHNSDHPQTLLQASEDIGRIVKQNPELSKSEALGQYFGDYSAPSKGLEEQNTNFNLALYGNKEGISEKENVGGGLNPPTTGFTRGEQAGSGAGETPFDSKGYAASVFTKFTRWNRFFTDFLKPSEQSRPEINGIPTTEKLESVNPIITQNSIASLNGFYDKFNRLVKGLGLYDPTFSYLETMKDAKNGYTKSLNDTMEQMAKGTIKKDGIEGIYTKFPELFNPKSVEPVYHFIDTGGTEKTLPKDFTDGQKALFYLCDNIGKGSGDIAKQLIVFSKKHPGIFDEGFLAEVAGDPAHMKRMPYSYLDSNLQDVMKKQQNQVYNNAKYAAESESGLEWVKGNFKSAFEIPTDKITTGRVRTPDDLFKSRKYWKATNEGGEEKIIHISDDGTVESHHNNMGTFSTEKFSDDKITGNSADGKEFIDKNGGHWKISGASVNEIEANTNERYLKDPLYSKYTTYRSLSELMNQARLYSSMMSEPMFSDKMMLLSSEKNIPFTLEDGTQGLMSQKDFYNKYKLNGMNGMDNVTKQAELSGAGFKDLTGDGSAISGVHPKSWVKMEGLPKIFDNVLWRKDVSEPYRNIIAAAPQNIEAATRMGLNMILSPMFVGNLGHFWNLTENYGINTTTNILNGSGNIFDKIGQTTSDVIRAQKSISSRDDLYKFVSSMGHRFIDTPNKYNKFLEDIAANGFAEQDPSFKEAMKPLQEKGKSSGKEASVDAVLKGVNGVRYTKDLMYKSSNHLTWIPQNISNLSTLYSEMRRRGLDLDNMDYADPNTKKIVGEAVEATSKKVVDYKVPTYLIPNKAGRVASQILGNKAAVIFAGYNLGNLKILKNDFVDALKATKGSDLTPEEMIQAKDASVRWGARTMMLGAHYMIQNAINKNQEADKYKNLRYIGDLKTIHNLYTAGKSVLEDLSEGNKLKALDDVKDAIASDFTVSPVTENAIQVYENRDYAGNMIYNPNDSFAGKFSDIKKNIVGGDNVVKLFDGLLQQNKENVEESIIGSLAPVNFVYHSDAEKEGIMQATIYKDYTLPVIKKMKGNITDLESGAQKQVNDLRKSDEFINASHSERTKMLQNINNQYVHSSIPLYEKWYSTMFNNESSMLNKYKVATKDMVNDIMAGQTTPTLDSNMPLLSDADTKNYNQVHKTNFTNVEATQDYRLKQWTAFEKQIDARIENLKGRQPDHVFEFLKSSIKGVKDAEMADIKYQGMLQSLVDDPEEKNLSKINSEFDKMFYKGKGTFKP